MISASICIGREIWCLSYICVISKIEYKLALSYKYKLALLHKYKLTHLHKCKTSLAQIPINHLLQILRESSEEILREDMLSVLEVMSKVASTEGHKNHKTSQEPKEHLDCQDIVFSLLAWENRSDLLLIN